MNEFRWTACLVDRDRASPKSQFQTPSFDKTPRNKDEGQHTSQGEPAIRPLLSPQGIYLHGHVGSGKSMLMDMFFESITTTPQSTEQLLHGTTNANPGHDQIIAVRTHFQPFMVELLDTLHNWRREETLSGVSDEHERARWEEALNNSTAVLTRAAAKSIASRCRLMCFDEVQIPDPCSAALVHSLFSSLLQYGVVLVATSNRPPHELDGGGFRGASFTPFVNMLVDHCDVLNLSKHPSKQMRHHANEQASHDASDTSAAESTAITASAAVDDSATSEHREDGEEEEEEELPCFDYRLSNAEAANVASSPPFFLYPGSEHVPDATPMSLRMDKLWDKALAAAALEQEELSNHLDAHDDECDDESSVPIPPPPSPPPPLKVYGREINGQDTSACGRVARFGFDVLCGDARPLGPADYNAIARRYHTVFVDDVPAFHMFNRHLARRLIWFVDALYESRANLVASAAARPLDLFHPTTTTTESEAPDVMALESLGSLSETATGRFALADAPPQFLSAPKASSTFRPEQLELFTGAEDVFAFERCVSRLMEMQTPAYRSQQHRPTLSLNSVSGSPAGFGSMPGAPPPLPVEEEVEEEDEDGHGILPSKFHCFLCVCPCIMPCRPFAAAFCPQRSWCVS